MYSVMKLAAALTLVGINAFFVMAEFSLVRIRKTRLEELVQQGNGRAALALKMANALDAYLSASQLGITLASLALGWLGEPAVASLLEPLIVGYLAFVPGWFVHTMTFVVSFTLITFLHIVLGELVPRSVALQRVETLALFCAWPLYSFYRMGYPIIVLFNRTAKMILTGLGIRPVHESEIAHSEDELRIIVSASERGGVLDHMESRMIDNVFDFADRMAREVMVPRQDMVCLFTDDSFADNLEVVRSTGHTRYPLCVDDKDHVLGMVHLRDVMGVYWSKGETATSEDLSRVVRELLVVPEAMPIANLLQRMQKKRIHLALVADEYGGTAGLVAMEDLLEEIVGDIQDEYDQEEAEMTRLPDGSYEFDGLVLLDEATDLLQIDLSEQEEDTLGGYVFGLLGRRPEIGDKVNIGDYSFEVLRTKGFRVVRLRAQKRPQASLEGEE